MADYTSQNVCYQNSLAQALVNSLSSRPSAALLASPTVALFDFAGYAPTPSDTLASLTAYECGFYGYTRQSLSLTGPVNLTPFCQGAIGNVQFQCTSGGSATNPIATAYGIISGGSLMASEALPASAYAPFANPGDFLVLNLELPMQNYQVA